MSFENTARSLHFPLILIAVLASGCAGPIKNMEEAPPEKIVSAPEEGKSLIVFMRPSVFGGAIQSSVFLIDTNQSELIGIVAAKKKVSYQLDSGEHLFMVIGESADFMSAELAPDKTYYALVTPRMGLWKARFSLKPIHRDDLDSAQFKEWRECCEWVSTTPDSYNWAAKNMASIQSKRTDYFDDWMAKNASDRPRLYPQDGT